MMTNVCVQMLKKKAIIDNLRERGCKTSFRTKEAAQIFLDGLYWTESFPWNDDQKRILAMMDDQDHNKFVVQGTFGSGKTSCMLALFMKAVLFHGIPPDRILLCAFNVCIRNELRKKIKKFGFKKKPQVRTFDSMIYEVCRAHEMEHLERPDYEGRRRFVERLFVSAKRETLFDGYQNVRMVLVDEVQDLDQKASDFFNRLFPTDARFFFFGDIFQCIQKEPRCSLLWHLLQSPDCYCHFMRQTPRVPPLILSQIQHALVHHYPEYQTQIMDWYSTNKLQDGTVVWRSISNYNETFHHCLEFLKKYPMNECMILTFSSAITVRGSMGDLCRFRQFLLKNGIQVPRNYKSMEDDKVFLSTVNSSKGLERPYVFIALTFPLELAFANFSNDLVVNLVSVGLSRCKKSVEFCVPAYQDRFSDVLHLYKECPHPDIETKTTPIPTTNDVPRIVKIMESAHSVTEVLRQSILSYGLRAELRAMAKFTSNGFAEGTRIRWTMRNEEEAGFMGVLYEVLITCAWTNQWPRLDMGSLSILQNPMYAHCKNRLQKRFHTLVKIFHGPFNSRRSFKMLYEYTQYFVLLSQKINVSIHPDRQKEMSRAWDSIYNEIMRLRPHETPQKPQMNLCRPLMTGIADMICESDPLVLYEIKTCSGSDWKEDAFTQAALYMTMTQQKRGKIRLLNPFRRELCEYQMAVPPSHIIHVKINREMLLWNLNCFLAKYDHDASARPVFRASQFVCTDGDQYLEWLAPTKTRIGFLDEYQARTIVRWSIDEPLLRDHGPPASPEGLTAWFLKHIDYRLAPETKSAIDWDDPFSHCVLMALFLRCHYNIR